MESQEASAALSVGCCSTCSCHAGRLVESKELSRAGIVTGFQQLTLKRSRGSVHASYMDMRLSLVRPTSAGLRERLSSLLEASSGALENL